LRENSHARFFYWNKKIRTKKGVKEKGLSMKKFNCLVNPGEKEPEIERKTE
jgi:hypothetical protein